MDLENKLILAQLIEELANEVAIEFIQPNPLDCIQEYCVKLMGDKLEYSLKKSLAHKSPKELMGIIQMISEAKKKTEEVASGTEEKLSEGRGRKRKQS